MTIRGIGAVINNLRQEMGRIRDANHAALYQQGFRLMAKSTVLCPVKEGVLIRSAYVAPPTKKLRGTIVECGYGTHYAWKVHEMTSVDVNWTKPGSGPKYLERPLYEIRSGHKEWIRRKTIENYNRGITARAIPARRPSDGGS